MDSIKIIGFAAAAFITAANFPQVYKIIRDKDTSGISNMTYLSLVLGNALWLIYGILKPDWPILIANAISTTSSTAILILNLTSKKTIEAIHKNVLPEKIQKEAQEKNTP